MKSNHSPILELQKIQISQNHFTPFNHIIVLQHKNENVIHNGKCLL